MIFNTLKLPLPQNLMLKGNITLSIKTRQSNAMSYKALQETPVESTTGKYDKKACPVTVLGSQAPNVDSNRAKQCLQTL